MSRQDKVAEAIRKEASLIIHDELKDPRLGFVTVTAVELSQDLRYARIFFSVLGKEEEYKKTKIALDSASGFIRRLIAQRVRLMFAPEIVFKEDRSSEYSVKIQEVLDEIKALDKPRPSPKGKRGTKRGKEKRSGHKKGRRLHKKV
jgi:ribosome-binding factor A